MQRRPGAEVGCCLLGSGCWESGGRKVLQQAACAKAPRWEGLRSECRGFQGLKSGAFWQAQRGVGVQGLLALGPLVVRRKRVLAH